MKMKTLDNIIDDLQYDRIKSISSEALPKCISATLAKRLYDRGNKNIRQQVLMYRDDVSFFDFHDYDSVDHLYLEDVHSIAKTLGKNEPYESLVVKVTEHLEILKKKVDQTTICKFLRVLYMRNDIPIEFKLELYANNHANNWIIDNDFRCSISCSANPNDVLRYMDAIEWKWDDLVICSPKVGLEFITNHMLDKITNFGVLAYNPNIDFEDMIRFGLDKIKPSLFSLFKKYVEKYGCIGEEELYVFTEKIAPYLNHISSCSRTEKIMRLMAFSVPNLMHMLPNLSVNEWRFFLESNPNITWDDYVNVLKPIMPTECLNSNVNDSVYKVRLEEDVLPVLKREFAAARIQRTWRRCISDPGYLVCRSRLYKEYDMLTKS